MEKVLILLLLAFALVESRLLEPEDSIDVPFQKEEGEPCRWSDECRSKCCKRIGHHCGYRDPNFRLKIIECRGNSHHHHPSRLNAQPRRGSWNHVPFGEPRGRLSLLVA